MSWRFEEKREDAAGECWGTREYRPTELAPLSVLLPTESRLPFLSIIFLLTFYLQNTRIMTFMVFFRTQLVLITNLKCSSGWSQAKTDDPPISIFLSSFDLGWTDHQDPMNFSHGLLCFHFCVINFLSSAVQLLFSKLLTSWSNVCSCV